MTLTKGSNGKTTTVSLLGEIMEAAGIDFSLGGNIGEALTGKLEGLGENSWLVAEVSSFQLDTVQTFRPRIAVILNLTPDHLDRYSSVEAYYQSKLNISRCQRASDLLIINRDDVALSGRIVSAAGRLSRLVEFSTKAEVAVGTFVRKGQIIYRDPSGETPVLIAADLQLVGTHNLSNALAAVTVAFALNIKPETIARGLKNFSGVPHRLERLPDKRGVQFYNDSKATNVDSVRWALLGFSQGIHLIAGGRDKGSDFASIKKEVGEKVKAVYAIGEAAEKLKSAWGDNTQVHLVKTLERAVHRAFADSLKGETILLSPACASFDQYKNFEARGDHFREIAESL